MTEPEIVPLNSEAALRLKEDMDALLVQISSHEIRLSSSYARLGGLLREVKINQYWRSYGYPRFSSYLDVIREKIDRRRSQVYAFLSVAEALLPFMTEEKLEDIGVTKAHELKRLVKQGGNIRVQILDPAHQTEDECGTIQLMDYAADPKVTASLLRIKVNEQLHVHDGPRGNWLELGGFYATIEERKEISEFWELGRQILEIAPESEEHETRKQVFLAAVRESLGTWRGELANA